MKIQIWGKSKCFDTKKAERYFKERRIPYQAIDLLRYAASFYGVDSTGRIHALAERLRKNGGPVAESHRDMGRS